MLFCFSVVVSLCSVTPSPAAYALSHTVLSQSDAGSDAQSAHLVSAQLDAGSDEGNTAADGDSDETAATFGDLDDLSLEQLLEMVVTPTKTAVSIHQTPAIITVVSKQQIDSWGYHSIAEVLRHMAGFFVVDDHMLPNVGMRGIAGGLRAESSLIKVMIDGTMVSFRSTTGNWLGPELVPLSAVEKIEIIRGPAAALYGADAFLGVLNIITRSPKDGLQGQATLGGTVFNRQVGGNHDLTVAARHKDFTYMLATRLHTVDNSGLALPDSSPNPLIPTYRSDRTTAEGLRRYSGSGLFKLQYDVNQRIKLALWGYSAFIDAGGEFADWYQLAHGYDREGRYNENRISLAHALGALSFDWDITEHLAWGVDTRFFIGRPTSRDRISAGSDMYYITRDFGFHGGEVETNLHWKLHEKLSLLLTAALIWDEEKLPSVLRVLKYSVGASRPGDIQESGSVRQLHKSFINAGGNLQLMWQPLAEKLGVTGGLRYDYHNIYGNQLSGRLGATSSPRKWLHFKLLYGNAFKAPSALLLYGIPYRSGDIIGNPELKAQRIHTVEGQVAFDMWQHLQLKLCVAYNILLNKAEFTPQGVNLEARNVAQVNALTVEAELRGHWARYLEGYLNLSYNYTVRDSGEEGYRALLLGNDNLIFPPLIISGGLQLSPPKVPLRAGVEATYVSARNASADNILENVGSYQLPHYVMLHLTLSTVKLQLVEDKQTRLMFKIRNLTDTHGPQAGYGGIDYPLAGRTFEVSFTQEF